MGHAQEVCFIGLFLSTMKISAHFDCYDIFEEYINGAERNWNELIQRGTYSHIILITAKYLTFHILSLFQTIRLLLQRILRKEIY
jgi:hypothetical protein